MIALSPRCMRSFAPPLLKALSSRSCVTTLETPQQDSSTLSICTVPTQIITYLILKEYDQLVTVKITYFNSIPVRI